MTTVIEWIDNLQQRTCTYAGTVFKMSYVNDKQKHILYLGLCVCVCVCVCLYLGDGWGGMGYRCVHGDRPSTPSLSVSRVSEQILQSAEGERDGERWVW